MEQITLLASAKQICAETEFSIENIAYDPDADPATIGATLYMVCEATFNGDCHLQPYETEIPTAS